MWWRRRRALKGLNDDIHDHMTRETEELVGRGMTAEEARRQALLRFGNAALAQEDTRSAWSQAAREVLTSCCDNRATLFTLTSHFSLLTSDF